MSVMIDHFFHGFGGGDAVAWRSGRMRSGAQLGRHSLGKRWGACRTGHPCRVEAWLLILIDDLSERVSASCRWSPLCWRRPPPGGGKCAATYPAVFTVHGICGTGGELPSVLSEEMRRDVWVCL